jgi:hypothetical protein
LLNEHQTGFADHSSLLWGLLSVEIWHRLFIDQPVRRDSPPSAAVTAYAH